MADGPALGTAYLRIAGDFSQVNSQMVGLVRSSQWSKYGKAAGGAFAGAIAAAGAVKALYEVGQAFDESYDTIRTTTGATGKELKKLEGDFKAVVKSVPTDFDTAAEAVSGLNQRLDLTGKPLRSLSRQMTELSRITGTDITSNVRSVTRLFGDWSVKTGKQEKTLDGLFRLTQQTGIEFGDLADTMVQFGSPMRTLGLDFDFAAAMIAKFEKEGVNMTTLMSGLRLSVANLSDPTDELEASFKKFGITAKEPAEQVFQVMEAIKETASVTKGNTLAFEVFGRRAGSDMAAAIREGRFELDDLMGTMEKGKETIRGAGEDTMDFAEHWQRFKNNVLVGLEPVATRVFEGIGDAMKDITDIISDPNLTKDEKLSKLTDIATDALGDLASAAGRMAPKVAGAFVEGFIKADVWGKLLAGAWISKALLGTSAGKSAYSKLGTTAGSRFGRAFLIGAVTFGLAEFGDDIFNWAKGLGEKFKKTGYNIGYDFGRNLAEAFNDTIGAIPGVDNIEIGPNKYEQHAQAQELEKTRKREERRGREHVGVMLRQGREFSDAMLGTVKDSSRKQGHTWEDLGDLVERVGRGMNRDGRRESGKLARGVAGNVGEMVNTASQGLRTLGDNTNEALSAFEVKKVAFSIKVASKTIGAMFRQRGGPIELQHGGLAGIVPGYGTGDTVPLSVGGIDVAKVEPREGIFVGNRNLMATLAEWNDRVPRFQGGGIVPVPGFPGERINAAVMGAWQSLQKRFNLFLTDAYGPGHASAEHTRYGTAVDVVPGLGGSWADVTRAVAHSVRAGYTPTYYDGSGGSINLPPHGPGHHAHITLLTVAELLSGKSAGGVGAILKRLILEGPNGPLKRGGQGALDMAHEAASKFLARQQPVPEMGESFGAVPGGTGRKLMAAISKQRGWNFGDWWALDAAETSHGANLTNPSSTARLRGQFLDMNWGKYGPGSDPAQNPSMREQIISMAAYIAERYGNPTAAWNWHQGHDWYQKGGEVEMLQRGGEAGGRALNRAGNLRGHLGSLMRRIGMTDERIDIAQRLAGTEWSPGGSELSAAERDKQLKLLRQLKARLNKASHLSHAGMGMTRGVKGDRARSLLSGFRDVFQEVSGVTGRGGRRFDTDLAIRELKATPLAGALGAMGSSQFKEFADAIRLGAFSHQMPPFAGWHGDGGQVTASHPTLIGIGDRGMETATITPGPAGDEGPWEMTITNWDEGRVMISRTADRRIQSRERETRDLVRRGSA